MAIAATALVACSQPTEPPVDAATAYATCASPDVQFEKWRIVAELVSPAPSAAGCRIQGRTKVDDTWVVAWMCPEFQQTFIHHDGTTVLAESATGTGLSIWAGGNPCLTDGIVRIHEWWGLVSLPLSSPNEVSALGVPTGHGSRELDSFVCKEKTAIVDVAHRGTMPTTTIPAASLAEFDLATGKVVRTWPNLAPPSSHVLIFALDANPVGAVAFSGALDQWSGPYDFQPYAGVAEPDGTYRWHRKVQAYSRAYREGEATDVAWTGDGKLFVVVAATASYMRGTANLVRLDPESGEPLFHMGLPGSHVMQDNPTRYMGGIRLWRRGDSGLLVTRVADNDPTGTGWTGQVLALDGTGEVLTTMSLPTFDATYPSSPAPSNIDGELVDVAWGTSVYRLRLPLAP